MNIEFHYYMVYYLAKEAGYSNDETHVIAYASQHTDDNQHKYSIENQDKSYYQNHISQTMDILNPMDELMRIYLCFHFLPGDHEDPTAYRKDGKLHFLNTTPNSSNAKKIMKEALESNSLYRLGIALHVLADTWSHQNFIGCKEYINLDHEILKEIIPNIGHAEFLHAPDMVSLEWEDNRLIPHHSKINNKVRMLEAAKECFKWLLRFKNIDISKSEIEDRWLSAADKLSYAMGEVYTGHDHNRENRINSYKTIIGDSFKEYNKEAWFKEAIKTKEKIKWFPFPRKNKSYSFKDVYKDSHWFKYQESVKSHQSFVKSIIKDKLDKMEILNF